MMGDKNICEEIFREKFRDPNLQGRGICGVIMKPKAGCG